MSTQTSVTMENWRFTSDDGNIFYGFGFPLETGNGKVRYLDFNVGKIRIVDIDIVNKEVSITSIESSVGVSGRMTPLFYDGQRVVFLAGYGDPNTGDAGLGIFNVDIVNKSVSVEKVQAIQSGQRNPACHPIDPLRGSIMAIDADSPDGVWIVTPFGSRSFSSNACPSGYFGMARAFDGRCILFACHYWIPGSYSMLSLFDTETGSATQITQYDSGCGAFSYLDYLPDNRLLATGIWCSGTNGRPSYWRFFRLNNCSLQQLGAVDTGSVVDTGTCNQNNRYPIVYKYNNDGSMEAVMVCYHNASQDQGVYIVTIDQNYNARLVAGAKTQLSVSTRGTPMDPAAPTGHLIRYNDAYYAIVPATDGSYIPVARITGIQPNRLVVDAGVSQRIATKLELIVKVIG